MAQGDHEAIGRIRKGFEVLRYEDTRISYYRMHRLLVRHEPLRFPEVKKREMLQDIRAKEKLAVNGTGPVLDPGMDYGTLLFDIGLAIIRLDLSQVFTYGASGILLLMALPVIMAVNGVAWSTLGISALLLTFAFFALKARTSDYVTYPEQPRS